jgi:nitroreductase
MLAKAPLGMVVCGDINAAHGNELSYMLQDCSAAIQNLLLAVHAHGLGACWLGVHPRMERVAHIQNIFQLPEHVIPISCVAIGYPAEQKEPRTRYNEAYVHYEKW